MFLVTLSVAALFVGPALERILGRPRALVAGLDGFVLVSVGGMVLLHLLPHAFASVGAWAAVAAVAGFVAPIAVERGFASGVVGGRALSNGLFLLAFVGLAVHAAMDGAVMNHELHGAHPAEGAGAHEHNHTHAAMVLGVVLHRLPLGLLIWWVVRPRWGIAGVLAIVCLIGGGTAYGYAQASAALAAFPEEALALFMAFVGGSLLHVAAHDLSAAHGAHEHAHGGHAHEHAHGGHAHEHAHEHAPGGDGHAHWHAQGSPGRRGRWAARFPGWAGGLGALAGVGAVLAVGDTHPLFVPLAGEREMGETFSALVFESAPALAIAFVGAGLLRGLLTAGPVAWLGRGGSFAQAARGVSFGLPLPICSCGVLPFYEALVRGGAAPVAALAFLVATPELGIDAVLISLPLLGPELTAARVTVAVVAAFVVALALGRRLPLRFQPATPPEGARAGAAPPLRERLKSGLRFGLGELVDHTLPWVLVGLALAALIEPLISADGLTAVSGWIQVPLFALAGLPAYICATGATPLVAVLLHKGLVPGAAIALLLTGPATNLTTFGVLSSLHGRRAALAFGLGMLLTAVLLGWAVHLAFPGAELGVDVHGAADHDHTWVEWGGLVVLTGVLVGSLLRQGPRGFLGQLGQVRGG